MSQIDQRMVRALAHPLRVELLREFEKGPNSPKGLADHLEVPLGTVSYHVKVLADNDCLELVETKPKRGALEHFYRLKPNAGMGARTWRDVPPALRTRYAGTAFAEFTTRAIEALDAGTTESREGSGLTYLTLQIDEQGWKELLKLLGNVGQRVQLVAAKCATRVASAGGDSFPAMIGIAAFEIGDGKDVDGI